MKKYLIVVIFLLSFLQAFSISMEDSLLNLLDAELKRENYYVDAKINKIENLKSELSGKELSVQYHLIDSIFEQYKSFNYDSAFNYIRQLQNIGYELNDNYIISSAKIKLGFIFLSSGMFKEAFDSLSIVSGSEIPEPLKPDYYSLMAILHYGLSDLQDRYYAPVYEKKAHLYIDSVLMISSVDSYNYLYYKGLRHVRKYELDQAFNDLDALRQQGMLSFHQKAIISSTMSDIYINRGELNKAMELLAEASILDIKAATKETAAILNLANILYRQGDIQRAYTYTKRALEDANFYGARHRKIQVGSILPIIEEEKINTVEKQKRLLLIYSLIVTALSIFVVLFIAIILRQLKKLKTAEINIIQSNKALTSANQKLLEANKIKEEYIGYYFNINSNYIEKIEKFKNEIEKNLRDNKFDNIRYLVNRIDLKKDRTALFNGFDRVFLKLFPGFLDEFNSLFADEDKIVLGKNELLNTDLRIFALIRLGIYENDKIARILELSVNTIYTYKTRIRNKSVVPNEIFEKRIMEIKFT